MKVQISSKPLTLAQMLMIFYYMVEQVNEYQNKNRNYNHTISDPLMKDLKKELDLMASDNDYMNCHIWDHVSILHREVKELLLLEDFIYTVIRGKYITHYLTQTDWNYICMKLCISQVNIVSFRYQKIKIRKP